MRRTNYLYLFRSAIAFVALFFVSSVAVNVSAQSNLPSVIAFTKELQSEFAKGDSENASWVRKVFTPQLLSSSTPNSIQDTIISTTIKLQSIHLKNSSGIVGYLMVNLTPRAAIFVRRNK